MKKRSVLPAEKGYIKIEYRSPLAEKGAMLICVACATGSSAYHSGNILDDCETLTLSDGTGQYRQKWAQK